MFELRSGKSTSKLVACKIKITAVGGPHRRWVQPHLKEAVWGQVCLRVPVFFSLCIRLVPGEAHGSDQARTSLFSAVARLHLTTLREMLFWGVSARRIGCRWMEVVTPQQVLAISAVSPAFSGHFRWIFGWEEGCFLYMAWVSWERSCRYCASPMALGGSKVQPLALLQSSHWRLVPEVFKK